MRRLPPLTAIEAFVQVARLGSVKAAAAELALSSPALSRRVQALERFIAKPLFERRHQAMHLNTDGERLLAQIAPSLDRLSDALEAASGSATLMRLRLGVPPLFASQRLVPQLASLRDQHPDLHLDIDTAGHAVSRLGDGLDAVIVLAREIDPGYYSRRLDRNVIFAIGGTSLLENGTPVTDPAQLARLTVLVHRDMPDTFTAWLDAAGLPPIEPLATDHFDSGALMLEAAAQGLGVAFMHASHFKAARDPRLVRLFDVEIESRYNYWFVCRQRALNERAVRLFHEWAITTLGADPA